MKPQLQSCMPPPSPLVKWDESQKRADSDSHGQPSTEHISSGFSPIKRFDLWYLCHHCKLSHARHIVLSSSRQRVSAWRQIYAVLPWNMPPCLLLTVCPYIPAGHQNCWYLPPATIGFWSASDQMLRPRLRRSWRLWACFQLQTNPAPDPLSSVTCRASLTSSLYARQDLALKEV